MNQMPRAYSENFKIGISGERIEVIILLTHVLISLNVYYQGHQKRLFLAQNDHFIQQFPIYLF